MSERYWSRPLDTNTAVCKDTTNVSENDKSNGGVNKLGGMNIFTRSRAVIVLSMLALILALWLQSVMACANNGRLDSSM